jgi:hypothetical protein
MITNLVFFFRQMVSTMEDEVTATLSIILLWNYWKRGKLRETAGQDLG